MSGAALTAQQVVTALGWLAIQGTLLALLALALAGRGKASMRPAWQAAVWLVVLARFALPWSPSLPWSLADLIASVRGAPEASVVLWSSGSSQELAAAGGEVATWWLVLAAAWAAGTGIVLVRALAAYRHALAKTRRSAPAPSWARDQLDELAARVGVRAPRLAIGDGATGPYVIGVVRPTIVVPRSLVEATGDRVVLRAALLHELAHVRRRDGIGRIVQLAAVALFWWLPVVRLASRRLELAREAACDAWALESGELSRPAYARLLVAMSRLGTTAAPALAARHALGDRVAGVLAHPLRPRLGWGQRLAFVAWALVALGGARSLEASPAADDACVYTLELAESLRQAHPEADADGDGVLSHDEACELQAEIARRANEQVSEPGATGRGYVDRDAELLAQPLCCNSEASLGPSTAATCPAPVPARSD
jgi:beta-lactamase regulating signal transducer with metallopeptidase domain